MAVYQQPMGDTLLESYELGTGMAKYCVLCKIYRVADFPILLCQRTTASAMVGAQPLIRNWHYVSWIWSVMHLAEKETI